jgi:hypothetical protein
MRLFAAIFGRYRHLIRKLWASITKKIEAKSIKAEYRSAFMNAFPNKIYAASSIYSGSLRRQYIGVRNTFSSSTNGPVDVGTILAGVTALPVVQRITTFSISWDSLSPSFVGKARLRGFHRLSDWYLYGRL